jgi:processive 1,2-diacylglycerol beta-glucosyltransferase
MKHLIFTYAVPRSGHSQAAQGLTQAVQGSKELTAEEYHLLLWHPWLCKFLPLAYRFMVRHTPHAWGHFHGNTSYRFFVRLLASLGIGLGYFGLRKKLKETPTQGIVSTHFLFTQVLGEARRRGLLNIPVFAVVTDFHAHPYWAQPGIDQYFVPSEPARADLISQGISSDKICVTGIPLKQNILSRPSRSEAYKQLGLNPQLKTVLIIGGSYGFFPFEEMLREILVHPVEGWQWLFMCGSDQSVADHLSAMIPENRRDRIRAFGYQKEISAFFSVADLAISKPGGIFTSEVLACGVPLVVHAPIPGQEEGNAQYLLSAEAAVVARSPQDAIAQARGILQDDVYHDRLKNNATSIAHPRAAQDILEAITHFLHTYDHGMEK